MAKNNMSTWFGERPEIYTIQAYFCELNGTMRSNHITLARAEKIVEGGLRMLLSVHDVDVWGEALPSISVAGQLKRCPQ